MHSSDKNTLHSERTVPPTSHIRHLWLYFMRYKAWFAAGALFLLLTNIMALAIPGYIGQAVESIRELTASADNELSDNSALVASSIMIIVLAIGAGITRVYSRTFIFNAGRHIEFDIRNDLYTALTRLTSNYYSSHSTGDITSRVANDVNHVRLLYAIAYLHIINATFAYSIAVYRMVKLDIWLTLACLVPYPLLFFVMQRIMRALYTHTKAAQAQLATLSTKVQENLSGIEVVKSYVIEDNEKRAYGENNRRYVTQMMKLVKARGALEAVMTLLAGSGTLVILILGSRRVIDGSITIAQFVEFNGYVVALAFPTIALGWVFAVWHRGLAAFERVREVMLAEKEGDDGPKKPIKMLPPVTKAVPCGDIRFQNISFSYDDKPILNNISLHIPAGSMVAIVGKTGAGKSTLVHLLARLYSPDSGTITIDGIDVSELNRRELRSELAFVPQDTFLFSMSIKENIRFGIDSMDYDTTIQRELNLDGSLDERIDQVVEIAGLAQEVDNFPDGLDTMVGERGVTLSGGQKQRVTIARALLTDSRVLVLDDALSSVDTETESRIMTHLLREMKGRTCILLTHRFNALHHCDKIFVLNEGTLVEEGTHRDLLERGGVYAGMFERQKLQSSLEADEEN